MSPPPPSTGRPTVELTAPDIGLHAAGNTGIPFVHTAVGPAQGPHVMITALVHGNEISGAIALDRLLRARLTPRRGRLTMAFANVEAFQQFDARYPFASRFVDEDMNRVWAPAVLDGRRDSVELRRARQLRPIIDTVDVLLDLHSMQHVCAPLTLAGVAPKGRILAETIGFPETVVMDEGHAAGTRLRDYGPFADPASPKTALLAECGQHWAAESAPIALETALRFLETVDILPSGALTGFPRRPSRGPMQVIEVTEAVTIRTERFDFVQDYQGLAVVPRAGTVIAHDGRTAIRTPYDDCVLIMPSRRLRPGQTAVRLGRIVGAGETRAAGD